MEEAQNKINQLTQLNSEYEEQIEAMNKGNVSGAEEQIKKLQAIIEDRENIILNLEEKTKELSSHIEEVNQERANISEDSKIRENEIKAIVDEYEEKLAKVQGSNETIQHVTDSLNVLVHKLKEVSR